MQDNSIYKPIRYFSDLQSKGTIFFNVIISKNINVSLVRGDEIDLGWIF